MEDSASGQEGDVGKISVRLPIFWQARPRLYFAQIEANFQLSKITTESTKYCSLVTSLDQQTMSVVADLIENPDAEKPYSVLKDRLIREFEISQTERIKTLLQDLTLSDSKPSALLRRMRELAGSGFSEEVLKSMWLARLPTPIQSILSVSSESLTSLSGLADKIFEVNAFSAPACFESSASQSVEISALRREIAELKLQVGKLVECGARDTRPRGRSHSRNFGQRRTDSNPRSNSGRSRTPTGINDSEQRLCWYHKKFADKARSCNRPCAYFLTHMPSDDQSLN